MINSAEKYPISVLLNIYQDLIYTVPPYQREYTWEKPQLDNLLDDILENDSGYFLGSMICINRSTGAMGIQELELVDGQQRMVTLSLIFAAIYSIIKEHEKEPEINTELKNLERMMVLRTNPGKTRVVPQISNDDLKNYRAVLAKAGVPLKSSLSNNYNEDSLISKAYSHLISRLKELSNAPDKKTVSIMEILDKLRNVMLVQIEVSNTSDAYMLFESLNYRGVVLSSVDLIKNKLFQKISEPTPDKIDYYSECWKLILDYLGDDYKVQERFFRQYFNAFRKTLLISNEERKGIKNSSIATRSNIIQIYKKLIEKNPEGFLERIMKASRLYSIILGRTEDIGFFDPKDPTDLKKALLDLERIEGTPSYLLLLYLFENKEQLKLENQHLCSIVKFLVRFFVRRNLTDRPATNSLTPLFQKIIDRFEGLEGDDLVEKIKYELVSVSSNDKEFLESLKGPIYSESSSLDRFILCAIESSMWPNGEPIYDLWRKPNGRYIWTIEHIFPQGKKIPPCWINMIAEGNEARAKDLQAKNVHRLGNLTLTGYNPNLSNMCFEDKRDRPDEDGNPIGYKNRLHLNDDIRILDKWTINDIEARTTRLVEKARELFALEDENKPVKIRQDGMRSNPMDRFFLDPDAIIVTKRGDGKTIEEVKK